MHILIAPDSFKGSLTAPEAAEAIRSGILRVEKNIEMDLFPIADGGEGTAEMIAGCMNGELIHATVSGPFESGVSAHWALLPDHTAVIEVAQAIGLTLQPLKEHNALYASSYGVGELIRHALDAGCRNFYITAGGSATNDGGMGMAAALGVEFRDNNNQILRGCGCNLDKIQSIDISALDPRIHESIFRVFCDVRNTLCGPDGASYIYGPQKGATAEDVIRLDEGLRHYAQLLSSKLNIDILNIPGGGAAGGLAGGLIAFCNAKLCPGAAGILEMCQAKERISCSDLVITGEGCLDVGTSFGKACQAVSELAAEYGIPVLVLSGSLKAHPDWSVFSAQESCVNSIMSLTEAIENASQLLSDASERAIRLILIGKSLTS